jgi:uncharacterized circularly permuted ATP-grasp superfamily protein
MVQRTTKQLQILSFLVISQFATAAQAVNVSNSCVAIFQKQVVERPNASTFYNRTNLPQVIPIQAESGIVKMRADNPYFDKDGKVKIVARSLMKVLEKRTPEEQKAIDSQLTEMLGQEFGMGFKKKDGTPFYVKMNGMPAALEKSDFNKLVKGMEPTFRLMRNILQTFMSNPDAKPEEYGLTHLTKEEVQYIINEMKSSPYFDKVTTNRNLKKYKFGSVYGVDATFGGLDKHLSEIFEINAGTPSGLSNITMILEVVRQKDPDLFKKAVEYLAENKAFEKLRETMDAHGKEMIEDGIAVEIGAGIYNGAHPDIAMISHFSGMPLVNRSDLFIDRDGFVRLKNKIKLNADGTYQVGDRKVKHVGRAEYKGHIQVWSIYSRSEEGNTLQQNTTRNFKGIGLKIPSMAEVNKELSRKHGIELEPGVLYEYINNQAGEPIDVVRNTNGTAKVLSSWDQFALDPIHSSHKFNRSLISSIHEGKIYLSNFGTRLIDHKGILSLVTKQAATEMSLKGIDPKMNLVATPVEARTAEEKARFFANPREFVVKVPDESGGVGVYILPTASETVVREVVEKVKAEPQRYVIQNTADFMSLLSVAEVNGEQKFVTKAFDGRVFMFVDAKGETVSDPFAILVRVADHLKLSTNTSQGAQYGWMAVLEGAKTNAHDLKKPSLPKAKVPLLAESHIFHLRDYIISMNMLKNGHLKNASKSESEAFLQNYWQSARSLMSVLGPEYSHVIDSIERVQRGEASPATLLEVVLKIENKLRNDLMPSALRSEINKIIEVEMPEQSRVGA